MNRAIILILACLVAGSCKKMVEIGEPTNSITKEETFATHNDAENAMAGIYYFMASGSGLNLTTGGLSLYCGTGADELIPFASNGDQQIFGNSIISANYAVVGNFWTPAYRNLYQINSLIEGVGASAGLSADDKILLTAEAKFFRALHYFYLVNLFGDVPYATTTDYKVNSLLPRLAKSDVYDNIIADLLEAQSGLPADYATLSQNERVRANKWAATALLARVYLYKGDHTNAEKQASLVINNTSLFELNPDLNNVYTSAIAGNKEAILQWMPNTSYPPYNGTAESFAIIPYNSTSAPRYYLTKQLLHAFEPDDKRRIAWLDSITYNTVVYYYPYRYKIGQSSYEINKPPTEYPTVLRLAEQYLIRAEAEANGAGGGLNGAIDDLNEVRVRAGLPLLPSTLDKTALLAATAQERRIEFFAEWGHRWFDLKRTGAVDSVMTKQTPLKNVGTTWHSFQQLWPIPSSELQRNPNLRENPGY